jgi:hypothetical protein
MNVKFITSIPFSTCKSQFLIKLRDKNVLPQVQQLNRLVHDHGNEIVNLIVNDHYCSLKELEDNIVSISQQAQQYLYLVINKFLVYSTVDTDVVTDNYDLRLVNYCQDIIANEFTLLDYSIRPDDNGTLGNFLHPVTTMFFKRNG